MIALFVFSAIAIPSLPQERRLVVWRLQSRRVIFGLVVLQSPYWSRFRHPQEKKGAGRDLGDFLCTGCTPQREATGTFDIYFSSSPDRGLLVFAVSRRPCLSGLG